MPKATIKMEVTGLKEMEGTFGRAGRGLGYQEVGIFEKTLAQTYSAVRLATHVETGGLRLSVIPSSHFDGDEWSGEVAAAHYPGIFELARGDTPSLSHPEGGHFFFNAVEPFLPVFADNVDTVFRRLFDETAEI